MQEIMPDQMLTTTMSVYQNLDRNKAEIRLLQLAAPQSQDSISLEGEFSVANLEENPVYKALSYTWGEPTESPHGIIINKRRISIRENLWLALNAILKYHEKLTIWIDAVCINQCDIPERNSQVAMMGKIYSQAREVLAWIGPGDDQTDLALEFAVDLERHQHDPKWVFEQFQRTDIVDRLRALGSLFTRPYWNRIWITQEVVLGRQVHFVCGNYNLRAPVLAQFQEKIYNLRSPNGHYFLNEILPDDPLLRIDLIWRGVRPLWELRTRFLSRRPQLYEALQYNFTKLATDPRDMVYGLHGLMSDECVRHIPINYECTTSELFAKAVQAEVFVSRKLDIITSVLWGHECPFLKPSWVPDWTARRIGHARLQNIREPHFQYKASGDSHAEVVFSPCGKLMTMQAVVLGFIENLGAKTEMTSHSDLKGATLAFSAWSTMIRSEWMTDTDRHISFSRTLLADRFRLEEIADLSLQPNDFLLALLGAWVETSVELDEKNATLSSLHSSWQNAKATRLETTTFTSHVLCLWVQDSCKYIWDRCFFLGTGGMMVLVPDESVLGDILCLPMGCSQPVVLRSVGQCHSLIGEAYVDGFMYGEVMTRVARDEYHIEAITLE